MTHGKPKVPVVTTLGTPGAARSAGSRTAASAHALLKEVPDGSFFSELPASVRERLTSVAVRQTIPAHHIANRFGQPPLHALLIRGLMRLYLIERDGREFTISYSRSGSWIGVPELPEGPFPCVKVAVTEAEILKFPSSVVHELGRTNAAFGWAVAGHAARGLYRVYDGVSRHILASLADRVAHHLFYSAEDRGRDGLLSPMNQTELADAVGSPRESVARVLLRFRKEGVVSVTESGIRISRPEALRGHSRPNFSSGSAPERRTSVIRRSAPRPGMLSYDEALAAAVARSALARVSPSTREAVLASGLRLDIPARSLLYRVDEPPRNGLLVSGLVRSFAVAPDGRQFTLVYSRPGSWLGLPAVAAGRYPLDVETLTDTIALEFPGELIERLARTEPGFSWALAEEITRREHHALDLVSAHALAPIAERIAHRLLELAVRSPTRHELIAPLRIGDLADSVGATPTSTSRVVRQLSAAGSIRQERDGLRILDPEALAPSTWVSAEQAV